MDESNFIIDKDSPVLVTGANGFIGRWVVTRLLERGFTKIRCLVRPPATSSQLHLFWGLSENDPRVEIFEGNLLSREDCSEISRNARVIFHLAAGRGQKSFSDAYLNSVVTTRNLLEACIRHGCLKRIVNMSSFTVYTNRNKGHLRLLDETCPLEQNPALRGDPYCFAKVRQEDMIMDYGRNHHVPYTIVRPGVVYGPGNEQIHGRVGLNTFGVFLHLGGANKIPLTFVYNCAEAMVLAGIVRGIDGEVFNVIDDDLPSSRQFLRLYKQHVTRFPSIYVPGFLSFALCFLWEKYSSWSRGQLPNTFNRKVWYATWRKTNYTNEKIKQRLGWRQLVSTEAGLDAYFESCRRKRCHA